MNVLFLFFQIPLIYLSSYMQNKWSSRCGNLLVWLSVIIGQPLAVMMYYHDFVVVHYGKELMQTFGKLNWPKVWRHPRELDKCLPAELASFQSRCREGSAVTVSSAPTFCPTRGRGGSVTSSLAIYLKLGWNLIIYQLMVCFKHCVQIHSGRWDTTNHWPFIAHNLSNNGLSSREFIHANFSQAGFELGSLGMQAGVLPIESVTLACHLSRGEVRGRGYILQSPDIGYIYITTNWQKRKIAVYIQLWQSCSQKGTSFVIPFVLAFVGT